MAGLQRSARAVWRGDGLKGSGSLTTPSGALKEQPYSTKLRFEDVEGRAGTNPEELVAAAHAGCFSMALSFQLAGAGHPPEELDTTATVHMAKEGTDWSITRIVLTLRAKVPGIDEAKFQELAGKAKAGCPISKALAAVDIQLEATLA